MASTPVRPRIHPKEIDPDTQAILNDRLTTIDQDERESVDAREALAEIRRNLKTLAPN